jgi:hypothetical protein
MPNDDGFFQAIVGCPMEDSDSALAQQVFGILRRVALACPVSAQDRGKIEEVFKSSEDGIVE